MNVGEEVEGCFFPFRFWSLKMWVFTPTVVECGKSEALSHQGVSSRSSYQHLHPRIEFQVDKVTLEEKMLKFN